MTQRWQLGRPSVRFSRSSLLALALAAARPCHGAEPAAAADAPMPRPIASSAPAVPVVTLGLDQCLQLARQRQPALAADRASLTAAEDARRGIESLHFPASLAAEVPARRAQAALGVTAAAAGLARGEAHTAYAVTRTYFTVVYARQQEAVARRVVERLTATGEVARRALDAGVRDVTAADVGRTEVYRDLAELQRIRAAEGSERALAALREAIGLGPDCRLDVADARLPEPAARPCREAVIAAALERRGELAQAAALADATLLEIEAQRNSLCQRKETFALGADLHARPIPDGTSDGQYRPAAVAPEMPGMLVGARPDRVAHARSLSARAAAVWEKARNLIVLEAEDAYLRWHEATQKVARARRAAANGDRLAEDLSNDFAAGQRVRVEDVTSAQVLAAHARSQYHEALYQQILALADLERITAGGFCAGFTGPAPAPLLSPAAKK